MTTPDNLNATTTKQAKNHWGQWAKARAFFVGFRNQGTLADAVGCTRTQLCRWFSMEVPPTEMRKGFDASLCRVLRVDRFTLLANYASADPHGTFEYVPESPALPTLPEAQQRRKIVAASQFLDGEKLRALSATAEALVSNAA
jgi:hypothetical protein